MPSKISREPQARNLRKEVVGGQRVGGRTDHLSEVHAAGRPADENSGRLPEETGRPVLPVEDGALPDRAIPEVDEEPSLGKVWVVLLRNADPGAPLQELPEVEAAAEDPVGGGSKGHGQGEESVQDQRLVCG